MKRVSLVSLVELMLRSRLVVIFLLAAIVGPVLWLDNSRNEPSSQSALVPPAIDGFGDSTQPRANSVYSPIGFANGTSPAELPLPSEFANRHLMIPGATVPQSASSPFGLPNSSIRPNATQAGVPLSREQLLSGYPKVPFGAETMVFPGNENGPDLRAAPMEFLPVGNLAEIFRFDVGPDWVKSRWDRISTSPIGDGFHGLRVPLVTGVNSWDIHGSLTYYFDRDQKLQRIGFQGWAGDPSRLIELLAIQFGFQAIQTNWAGCHVAKRDHLFGTSYFGGLLLQNPPVIRSRDPNRQIAVLLEINNPNGTLELSPRFQQEWEKAKR